MFPAWNCASHLFLFKLAMTINVHPDGTIVGLHGTTNGRSCSLHEVCGRLVKVDSLVWFKSCYVNINSRVEAIKAVLVQCGKETCTIGFLPRVVSLQPDARGTYNDEFAVIVYLHVDLDDNKTRQEGDKVLGMACFHLLKNINTADSI
jgi:hypothetical protein